jgi:hypothetical protein
MLMTAVIHPEAFDHAHFATPGYRDQAEMLLRGLESNGLLLIDPDSRLLKELNTRVEGLGTKRGQQLQIRLAELQKKGRKRVVVPDPSRCNCPTGLPLLDAAQVVQQSCCCDTLIVDSPSHTQLQAKGCISTLLTPLGSYFSSQFESRRHYCLDQVPAIDKMPAGEFEDHMVRCTRFSQRLRFYDKQIGHGSSLGGFALGIGKIIGLWIANAHFRRASLSVEIYTCVQRTHKPTDDVHQIILSALIRKLFTDHGVPVTLYFKQDASPALAHDRYLQTSSVAVYFSKGFDYVEPNGTLHRCTVKIDNGAYDHLQDYRNLKDHKPPAT